MILEFSIENTFSIKDKQTISFESVMEEKDSIHCINIAGKKILKQLCIYGANASGKSTFLKTVAIVFDHQCLMCENWKNFVITVHTIPVPSKSTIANQPHAKLFTTSLTAATLAKNCSIIFSFFYFIFSRRLSP